MEKDAFIDRPPDGSAGEGSGHEEIEEALRKASSEWRATFDATHELIMMVGGDCRIIKVNRATTDFFDKTYEEILGRDCRSFFEESGLPGELLPLEGVKGTGLHIESEVYLQERDIWILASADPIVGTRGEVTGIVVILRDITDLKKAEEARKEMQSQLLQVQKMDSIGRLAGGVAHDFNNMLSAILAYSEFAYLKIPEDHPARGNLQIVLSAAEKAAALTRQLLVFSRKQVLEKKVVNLGGTIDNTGRMLSRIIRKNVELDIRAHRDRRNILADQGQIEQIIMNLALNARDAMPLGGKLVIETFDLLVDGDSEAPLQEMEPGAYAALSVKDTGEGIPPGVREKIFDPFFTTKEEGKGTGLGLSTVYGIVRQHGGHILVDSEKGRGSTFTVFFPVTEVVAEETLMEKETGKVTGEEAILAVDDDDSIRMILADTLEPLGYTLSVTANGEEALRIMEKSSGRIDLLLADVMMPGMNGKELAEVFRKRWPETKVLLMSGYASDDLESYLSNRGSVRFIEKPLTPGKLASTVREVLDAAGEG